MKPAIGCSFLYCWNNLSRTIGFGEDTSGGTISYQVHHYILDYMWWVTLL